MDEFLTLLVNEDVFRLDIAIHDSIVMEILESGDDLSSVELSPLLIKPFLLAEMPEELATSEFSGSLTR